MRLADALGMSWTNLRRRPGRTALTSAGVVVGVAALVLMVSLGLGLEREVRRLFESEEQLRTLHVTRASADRKGRPGVRMPFAMGAQLLPITEEEIREMAALPGVASAVPDLDFFLGCAIEAEGRSRSLPLAPVGGIFPEEEAAYREALVAGTLWAERSARACLLPAPLVEGELGLEPAAAVGGRVTFRKPGGEGEAEAPLEFACVGVFDPSAIGLRGRRIVLPAAAAAELREATRGGVLSWVPYKKGTYAAAVVRAKDPREAEEVARRLRHAGYEVFSAADMIRTINIVFLVVEGFMAAVGAVGLIVSLFGIANTMAMAVLERTREIGIMKSLGARDRDIGRLFLLEAGGIGLLGGTLGIAAGALAGRIFNAIARGVFDLPPATSLFYLSPGLAAGALAFSVFVSVAAGFVPARRAARLEPVAALRYE
jgi:putative ABC transport system permease protein